MFASHSTVANRWEKGFKHEFLSLVWLREKDSFSDIYSHSDTSFFPDNLDNDDICPCGLQVDGGDKCKLCSEESMEWIDSTLEQGQLVSQLQQLYSTLAE